MAPAYHFAGGQPTYTYFFSSLNIFDNEICEVGAFYVMKQEILRKFFTEYCYEGKALEISHLKAEFILRL